jgi:hypothetical protein
MLAMKRKFDISQITDFLFISELPKEEDVPIIKKLGIKLVISMTWFITPKSLKSFPHTHVRVRAIDSPAFPIPMKSLFKGVESALPVIKNGGKILVHCKHGVHRSVAMAACILVANGYTTDQAIKLIKKKRSAAKPETGYIKKRILDFEKEWNEHEN